MKKSMKILLGILIPIIVLIITYVVLIITKVVPNPFLDTSDLVCYRSGLKYDNYKEDRYVIFSFDKWANLEKGKTEEHLIYYDIDIANKDFVEFQELFNDYSNNTLRLENNTIIIDGELTSDETVEVMNKKQIKQKYKEFNYECE